MYARLSVNFCTLIANTYVFFSHFWGVCQLKLVLIRKDIEKGKNFKKRIAGLKSMRIFVTN